MIIHNVEQRSPEWFALRAGRPTSSEFSSVVTTKGLRSESQSEYAKTLAGDKYAGFPVDSFGGNKYTKRGQILEPDAVLDYEFISGNTVHEVGFITDNLLRWGSSTDGLIGDDGLLEVKCLTGKHHIGAILYFDKFGRPPSTYIAQTQGELFVSERAWVDMFFYHPDLPSLIIRQVKIPDFHAALKVQLSAVLVERDRIFKILEAI